MSFLSINEETIANMKETLTNVISDILPKSGKDGAEKIYEDMKGYLKEKDGFDHVVMVKSYDEWTDRRFSWDFDYTIQIDTILTLMQQDGYEIIDVKFCSVMNNKEMGNAEAIRTLITYK